MKNKETFIMTIIATLIVIILFYIMLYSIKKHKETLYCGKVVKTYITPAGYKVYPERRVVFYCDSLKRNIDVKVTVQQFANTNIGEIICFELDERQLEE